MGVLLLGLLALACLHYGFQQVLLVAILLTTLAAFQTFDWRVWGVLIFLLFLAGLTHK